MPEHLHKDTARRRDDRWTAAHQKGVQELKDAHVKDGLAPDKAEAKAKRSMERITNEGRASQEGG